MSFAKHLLGLPNIYGIVANVANWSEGARRRLAEAVKARRAELGLSQLHVYEAGGPSNSTMTAIENATKTDISWSTLRKLDIGLQWPQDCALNLISGKALDQSVSAPSLDGVPTDALAAVTSALLAELQRRTATKGRPYPRLP